MAPSMGRSRGPTWDPSIRLPGFSPQGMPVFQPAPVAQQLVKPPPSFLHLDGFETGAIPDQQNLNNSLLQAAINSQLTIQSKIVRSGSYALKWLGNGASGPATWQKGLPLSSVVVVRFAFMLVTNISSQGDIISVNTGGSPMAFGLSTGGAIYVDIGNNNSASFTLTPGQWYVIEGRFDTSSTVWRVDWSVNGVPRPTFTLGGNAITQMAGFSLGPINTALTGEMYWDDLAISVTAADYPLGDGRIYLLSPDPAGTNTLSGGSATDLVDEAAASIVTGTALSHLDSGAPWENQLGSVPPTRFIKNAVNTARVLEFDFLDTAEVAVDGVQLVYEATDDSASNLTVSAATKRSDGTVQTSSTINVTNAFKRAGVMVVTPPLGGWTPAEVNALRGRIGGQAGAGIMYESVGLMIDVPQAFTTWLSQTVGSIDEALQGLAVALSDSIEALQPIIGTLTDPVESAQGVSTTTAWPEEALGGVAGTDGEVLEATGAIARTGAEVLEATQNVIVTGNADPLEAGQGVTTSDAATLEALGGVAATDALVDEATGGVAQTDAPALESLQGIATTGSAPVEETQGIAQTVSEPLEEGKGVTQTGSDPLEAMQGVVQTDAAVVEANQGVASSTTVPVEVAAGVVTSDSLVDESLSGIAASDAVRLESLQGIAQITAPMLDVVQNIVAATASAIEASTGVAASVASVLVEAAQGVASLVAAVFESLAGVVGTSDAPVEAVREGLTDVAASVAIVIEATQGVTVPAGFALESLVSVATSATSSLEVLTGISTFADLWLEVLLKHLVLGPTSTVLALKSPHTKIVGSSTSARIVR